MYTRGFYTKPTGVVDNVGGNLLWRDVGWYRYLLSPRRDLEVTEADLVTMDAGAEGG